MARVQIVLNQAGIREFLKSPSVQSMLLQHANQIAAKAGEGFTADVQAGKRRAYGRVTAQTQTARRNNLDNNTLLKALGGG